MKTSFSSKNIKLELIRAIAALEVFVNHSFGINPSMKGKTWPNVFTNWATEAVIIFFILSGIVIHVSFQKKPKDFRAFLYNRLLRIYPMYLIGIILAVISSLLIEEQISTKILIGNLFFLGTFQEYIVPVLKTNPVIWSLTYEMFFYLIFALTIGSHQKLLIKIWACISIICLPVYYLNLSGLPGYLVSMFAFSSIWLLGYYIVLFKDFFQKPRITQALFFLSLMPGISRLHIFPPYYDVFKYLLFSICSIPVFIFCLSGDKAKIKFWKINYLFEFFILSLVILSIIFFSKSLWQSKIIYCLIPCVLFAWDLLKPKKGYNFLNNNKLKKFSLYFGNLSYPVYIMHFPILLIFYHFFGVGSFIFQIPCFFILGILIIILFEKYYQTPVIYFFSRKKISVANTPAV